MRFKDSVRISVTFPRIFLDSLDGWANAKGMTRSAFLREAVRHYIGSIVKKGGNGETNVQKT